MAHDPRHLLVGATAVLWTAWLHLFRDASSTQALSNVGLLIAAGTAAARGALRARRSTGRLRTSWRLFALACGSWGAGQAVWTYYGSALGREVPLPSLADVGHLAFVPLTAAGLLVLPTAPQRLASLLRTVLDGLIAASSVLFVSWAMVIGPVLRSQSGPTVNRLIGLAYPMGDVLIITILLFALLRSRQRPAVSLRTLVLLTTGLLCLAVGGSGFVHLALSESYSSGSLIDGAWFAGFMLISLAASRETDEVREARGSAMSANRVSVLLPYAPVVVAIAVRITNLVRGSVNEFLSWTMVVLIVLVTVRQVVTLLDNMALTRNLEERVRQRTAELDRNEERFCSLVQSSSDVVTVVDRDGTIAYQSPSAAQVFGYEAEAVLGTNVLERVQPADQAAVVEALERASREPGAAEVVQHSLWHDAERWCQAETIVTNLLHDQSVQGLVLNTRDVSERKRLQDELVHQALHDPLTNLANRVLFKNRLEHALAQASRHHRPLAVLFCDLDGFKQINDSLGHAYGDEVLVEVAARLQHCVRTGDTVARLGGDEFAVMLEGVAGDPEVTAVADRIGEALRQPFLVNGYELFAAGSIGVALAESADDNADDVLRNADLAMYQAKAAGDGSYCWYEPTMHSAIVQRLELEADLRHALDRGQLHLAYQPIMDLGTGELLGAEALLRWEHPAQGPVPPADFIPVAESCGVIKSIGEWVLRTACRQVRSWQDEVTFPLSVSVNLSGHQVRQPDLVDVVVDALSSAGLDPRCLVLEMTESVLIEQSEGTLASLRRLKELGVKLAIDDFGTGFSSLSYLHRFPVDIITIDRSFVDRLRPTKVEAGLASSLVHIGQVLKLTTVAEGIEEPHQLDALRTLGCDRGQGFLLARPLSVGAFESLLGLAPGGGAAAPAAGPGRARAPSLAPPMLPTAAVAADVEPAPITRLAG